MQRRRGGFLWFVMAFAFALAAAWLTHAYIAANTRTATVVMAQRAVEPLAPIGSADLTVRKVPASAVPEGAVSDPADAVGGYATVGLVPGEVLLRSMVMRPGGPEAVSGDARITQIAKEADDPWLRAVPVQLDETHGYTLVRAGDRVDVFATVKLSSASMTTLVAQQVLVMAKMDAASGGQTIGLPGSASATQSADHGTVVLAVDRQTAERILLAQELGRITLALVPGGGQAPGAPVPPVTDSLEDWSGSVPSAPAPPAEGGR